MFNILSLLPFCFFSLATTVSLTFQNDHLLKTTEFVAWALLNTKWTEVSHWFDIPSFPKCEEKWLSITSKTREENTGTKRLNAGHSKWFRRAAKGPSNNAWEPASAKAQSKALTAVHPFFFSCSRMGFKEGLGYYLVSAFQWFNHLKWFPFWIFQKILLNERCYSPQK